MGLQIRLNQFHSKTGFSITRIQFEGLRHKAGFFFCKVTIREGKNFTPRNVFEMCMRNV